MINVFPLPNPAEFGFYVLCPPDQIPFNGAARAVGTTFDAFLEFSHFSTAEGIGSYVFRGTGPVDNDGNTPFYFLSATALADFMIPIPSTTTLALPNVLVGVEIVWAESSGEGAFETDNSGSGTIPSNAPYSIAAAESGNAESSASLIPELALDIRENWSRNVPTTRKVFYLPHPVTKAQILTKLSASEWPLFKPVGHTISLIGGKIALSARVSADARVSAESYEGVGYGTVILTEGEGESYDMSVSNNRLVIPPTIHGGINFTGDATREVELTAEAAVEWSSISSGLPIALPAASAVKTITKTLEGSVSPVTLDSTSPAAIPTSGIYLLDVQSEPTEWGYLRIIAEIIDASVLA